MEDLFPQHRMLFWQMAGTWTPGVRDWGVLSSTTSSFLLSPWSFHELAGAMGYRVTDVIGCELYSVDGDRLGTNSLDQILILQSKHGEVFRLLIERGETESAALVINRFTPKIKLEMRGDVVARRRSQLQFTGFDPRVFFLAAPLLPVPTAGSIRSLGMEINGGYWPEQSGWFATAAGSFSQVSGEGSDRWLPMGNRAFLVLGNEINADIVQRVFGTAISPEGFSQSAVVRLEVPIV